MAEENQESRGVGRPRHEPTEATRSQVKSLAAYGAPQEFIASEVGICVRSLSTHYRAELDHGMDAANVKIAQTLFKKATEGGDTTALIWWEKTRVGMKETVVNEHKGAVPTISADMDPKEAAAAYAGTINDE